MELTVEKFRYGKLYDYLPKQLDVNGEIFDLHTDYVKEDARSTGKEVERLKKDGYKVRKIKVLSKRLRGVSALHGGEYQPHEWIFIKKA